MAANESLWADSSTLTANRRRLTAEVRQALGAFERRYELPSGQVEQALRDGRLHETADICDWLIQIDLLKVLTNGGPPRLE